jgi:hypothetical protein
VRGPILWEIAIEKPFANAPSDEPVTSPLNGGSECTASMFEPRLFIEERAEPTAPEDTAPPRRMMGPTREQKETARKLVDVESEVITQIAAWWLPCTPAHIRRLVRDGDLVASNTRPKRITTASLREYKWRRAKGDKPESNG